MKDEVFLWYYVPDWFDNTAINFYGTCPACT